MKPYGYDRHFALGCIAGSACLGMLIPPSVLMIVWGVLTEMAIGKLFIAGIIPGLLVVCLYIGYILWVAKTQPHRVGEGAVPSTPIEPAAAAEPTTTPSKALPDEPDLRTILWSTAGIIALVLLVLGGIWFGFFTPTEGAGVGATPALPPAIAPGLKPREMAQAHTSGGRQSARPRVLAGAARV